MSIEQDASETFLHAQALLSLRQAEPPDLSALRLSSPARSGHSRNRSSTSSTWSTSYPGSSAPSSPNLDAAKPELGSPLRLYIAPTRRDEDADERHARFKEELITPVDRSTGPERLRRSQTRHQPYARTHLDVQAVKQEEITPPARSSGASQTNRARSSTMSVPPAPQHRVVSRPRSNSASAARVLTYNVARDGIVYPALSPLPSPPRTESYSSVGQQQAAFIARSQRRQALLIQLRAQVAELEMEEARDRRMMGALFGRSV